MWLHPSRSQTQLLMSASARHRGCTLSVLCCLVLVIVHTTRLRISQV